MRKPTLLNNGTHSSPNPGPPPARQSRRKMSCAGIDDVARSPSGRNGSLNNLNGRVSLYGTDEIYTSQLAGAWRRRSYSSSVRDGKSRKRTLPPTPPNLSQDNRGSHHRTDPSSHQAHLFFRSCLMPTLVFIQKKKPQHTT